MLLRGLNGHTIKETREEIDDRESDLMSNDE